ncbi:hypothetical protein TM51_12875 [Thermobifida fusca TM51]|uniref:Uncharacterized protein n=1 Tax=Thermobifida fusca TM51 TaxID=1169414 RepID=A0A9P2T9X0_THEFU|nr:MULTISPECIES: hypothetical protein [Thermobifida]EOR70435.1 hypothetical protein TM51_12875 [Thermobifida fusca TM51]MBO2530498.1 hypothetical protein [Thermobifida sp.]MDD6793066.1 hypothetical protein [Thermobifida fusca]QOS59006.1 hypothetical protein IM867_00720 [Thermobifida fusca]
MSSLRDLDPAVDRLPPDVRGRLVELDRLRDVWTANQRRRPSHQWPAHRARLFRRHILALHRLRGTLPVSEQTAERLVVDGFDSDNTLDAALREQLAAEEHTLISLAEASRTGERLSSAYLDEAARSLTGQSTPGLGERLAAVLADLAATPTHPVVRAALGYLAAEEAQRELGAEERFPRGTDPLAWAVASVALMRANHPPLIADHRAVAMQLPWPPAASSPDRHLPLIALFAELQIAVLRGELSWTVPERDDPAEYGQALARTVYRRLLEYLRQRAPALSMVLRQLDPASSARVTSGDSTELGEHRNRVELAADRALLARTHPSWWVCLEATCTNSTLRLLLTVQGVGAPATGVLAVTADALVDSPRGIEDALDLAPTDCVTLLSSDSADERWPEVAALTDEAISRAVDRLTSVMA